MKMTKYITGILIAIVLLVGCKTQKITQKDGTKPMPAFFDDNNDTSNMATLNWRKFFSDKNLIRLIDAALQNNWDVRMAFQRIQSVKSDILLSKGALKPIVDGVLAGSVRKFGLYTMDGAGNITTEITPGKIVPTRLPDYFVGLQASWEVDVWGKLKNQKKAAIARFLSTTEGRNLIITDIIAAIASAYYELLALDETVKILNENIQIREKAYAMVKVQKEAAATNELAVKQFEAQLLHLRASLVEVLQQSVELETRINFLSGRYPQPVTRDTAFLTNALPVQLKTGIPSALLQNRPDIRQAEFELMASKADVLAAKAAFYPTLNINGGLGFQAFKTNLLFTTPESIAYGLFGALTAPLINRAVIKAQFNRATAFQLETLYNYQKTVVNGYVEVYNEIIRAKNLQQLFDLKFKEASTLSQSIHISEQLFRTGRANYLEVLFTQQNALQARLELVETKKNQLLTSINIYKALGGGWR